MKHEMKLNNGPFNKIKDGTKTVELKLNDNMNKNILLNLESFLIIVTGMASSGKTTLANRISEEYKYPLLSMDDYKVELYEKYGFVSELERNNLRNLAKEVFCADIISYMRKNETIIIEYPFDISWQPFFDYIIEQYKYKSIVINCNSRDFDDIWNSRVKRDSECINRSKSLTASKYVKDIIYESNDKLNDDYKEIKRKEYKDNKYTSIIGNFIISDRDVIIKRG